MVTVQKTIISNEIKEIMAVKDINSLVKWEVFKLRVAIN
jgi:hypothetical protein